MEGKLKEIMGRLPATRKEFDDYTQKLKECEIEFAQLCERIENDMKYVSDMKTRIEKLTKLADSLVKKNNDLEETIAFMQPFTKESLMQMHRELKTEIEVLQYQHMISDQSILNEKNKVLDRESKINSDLHNLLNRVIVLEKNQHKNDMAAFVRRKK